jgi:hypothetical protein
MVKAIGAGPGGDAAGERGEDSAATWAPATPRSKPNRAVARKAVRTPDLELTVESGHPSQEDRMLAA